MRMVMNNDIFTKTYLSIINEDLEGYKKYLEESKQEAKNHINTLKKAIEAKDMTDEDVSAFQKLSYFMKNNDNMPLTDEEKEVYENAKKLLESLQETKPYKEGWIKRNLNLIIKKVGLSEVFCEDPETGYEVKFKYDKHNNSWEYLVTIFWKIKDFPEEVINSINGFEKMKNINVTGEVCRLDPKNKTVTLGMNVILNSPTREEISKVTRIVNKKDKEVREERYKKWKAHYKQLEDEFKNSPSSFLNKK